MAKEFDIYLRKHLVECDLVIYSIPYREGISVTDRMIMDAVLNGQVLRKIDGTIIQAEINAAIGYIAKSCIERANTEAELDVSASFVGLADLNGMSTRSVVDAENIETVKHGFEDVESGAVLSAGPLPVWSAMSVHTEQAKADMDASVTGTVKSSVLNIENSLCPVIEVDEIGQVDFIEASLDAEADAGVYDLCYVLSFEAESAVEAMATVLGAWVRHSLGRWYNGVAADAKTTGIWEKKFAGAEVSAEIGGDAEWKVIKVIEPDNDVSAIAAQELDISMRRRRLLSEADDLHLADIDGMTLEELDYVLIA